jgi:hypothetical protein
MGVVPLCELLDFRIDQSHVTITTGSFSLSSRRGDGVSRFEFQASELIYCIWHVLVFMAVKLCLD